MMISIQYIWILTLALIKLDFLAIQEEKEQE
jgi:hypothetical protein